MSKFTPGPPLIGISTEVKGLREADARLAALPEKLAKKTIFWAMRDAAELGRRAAVANARALFQRHTGKLFRGIIKKVFIKRHRAGATVTALVGLRSRKSENDKTSNWYGRLLETGWRAIGNPGGLKKRGTGPRVMSSKVFAARLKNLRLRQQAARVRRRQAKHGIIVARDFEQGTPVGPRPFLAPAFDQTVNAMINKFAQSLRARLDDIL